MFATFKIFNYLIEIEKKKVIKLELVRRKKNFWNYARERKRIFLWQRKHRVTVILFLC